MRKRNAHIHAEMYTLDAPDFYIPYAKHIEQHFFLIRNLFHSWICVISGNTSTLFGSAFAISL